MGLEVVEAVAETVDKITAENAKKEEPEVSYADSSIDIDVVEGQVVPEVGDDEQRTL